MMMSDAEEPPTKSVKMEVAPLSVESAMEGQEEGQEEWLSEEVLTDDDYLPSNVLESSEEQNNTEANGTVNASQESEMVVTKQEDESNMEQNIEDTLNNFEGTEKENKDAVNDLLKVEKESDIDHSDKQSDDDGHNTDDLLRMLGEDDGKKKKVPSSAREQQARRRAERSSDDDYVLEGAKMTRLKVAKNAVIRKPLKAEPEILSDRDSDMSEDDASTVKKMFGPKARSATGRAKPRPSTNSVKTEKPKPKTPTPKQYTNKKSLLKTQDKPKEHDEIINEEEFLEDDDFDLDDDVGDDSSLGSDGNSQPLRLRQPERMDEDAPSDEESLDDDSLYDAMPSSDSEDMDDWFTLDIRAERAGDYLPWLGDKAHKLLTEEKHRVAARLSALRQSVTALHSSGRVQSDQLKVATEALHDLDAMLAAA